MREAKTINRSAIRQVRRMELIEDEKGKPGTALPSAPSETWRLHAIKSTASPTVCPKRNAADKGKTGSLPRSSSLRTSHRQRPFFRGERLQHRPRSTRRCLYEKRPSCGAIRSLPNTFSSLVHIQFDLLKPETSPTNKRPPGLRTNDMPTEDLESGGAPLSVPASPCPSGRFARANSSTFIDEPRASAATASSSRKKTPPPSKSALKQAFLQTARLPTNAHVDNGLPSTTTPILPPICILEASACAPLPTPPPDSAATVPPQGKVGALLPHLCATSFSSASSISPLHPSALQRNSLSPGPKNEYNHRHHDPPPGLKPVERYALDPPASAIQYPSRPANTPRRNSS